MRLRVDGKVYDIDEAAQAAKNAQAHRRRRGGPAEGACRYASSVWRNRSRLHCAMPTAAAMAVEMDTGHEHLFSAKFACPQCSYALQELEPRLFSFNNPMGACPKCDGLGAISSSIPARWWPSRTCGWPPAPSRAGTGATSSTSRCCKAWPRITISTSTRRSSNLPETAQHILLYGSGKESIRFRLHERDAARSFDPQPRLRGHHPQPGTALSRNRLDDGARGTGQIPQHQTLPGVRRHAPAHARRATSRWAARPCTKSAHCR